MPSSVGTRIIVGIIAIPVVLIPVWLGGIWLALLFVVAGIVALLEFYHMMALCGHQANRWLGMLWLFALVFTGWAYEYPPLTTILFLGFVIGLIEALTRPQNPVGSWFATSMGALYLGIVGTQVLALRALPNGQWWLLYGFLVTWANDTAAYFIGTAWGRHKFWPRLSPKKSWEGSVGGWIAAAITGGLFVWLTPLNADASWLFGAAVGLCCGVLGLFGDLSISMLKRQAGVKDSGVFFPGHGGMLDRLDSLLFVLPFVYQVLLLWQQLTN